MTDTIPTTEECRARAEECRVRAAGHPMGSAERNEWAEIMRGWLRLDIAVRAAADPIDIFSADENSILCPRCDHPLDSTMERHMDEGGPAQCPRCGLPFEIEEEWLVENGYRLAAQPPTSTHG